METKTITMYKFYYLSLADMHGGVDNAQPVIGSFELEKLLEFYNNEKQPWRDDVETDDNYGNKHSWDKTFKKGSKLEWYNDVVSLTPEKKPDIMGGIGYVWLKNMSANIEVI